MLGMALKEFYTLGSVVKGSLLIVGALVILATQNLSNVTLFGGLVSLLLMMLPTAGFALDEQAGWERFAASTSAGRRGVVQGKYLAALVLCCVALTTILLLSVLERAVTGSGWDAGGLGVSLIILGMGLAMLDFLLPLLFWLGSQKARVVVVAVSCGSVGALASMFTIMGMAGSESGLLSLLRVLMPALALGGLGVSYFVSVAIYRNKEL